METGEHPATAETAPLQGQSADMGSPGRNDSRSVKGGVSVLIFVCSPMRGDRPYSTTKYNRNMRAAAQYSKTVVDEGHIPITPHLFFKDFMDDHDPEERKKAMEMSKQLLERCDEVWVFDENGTSEGMKGEIELASQLGKQVRYR